MQNVPSTHLDSTLTGTTSSQPEEAAMQQLRFRQSFEQIREELRSVPASELIAVNLDVLSTVATVLGAVPNLRPLRERMQKALPEIDLRRIDALETYARATGHAHTRHLGASRPAEPLAAMTERGTSLRNTLHTDVTSLANRGLVDAGRLDQYRGAPGYKVLAADLFLLADVLRGSWNQIASKTPVTLKELDEAEVLADRLLTSIGERAQAPTVPADSALDRQRAFTLLLHAYSEARRAVAFLRWYEGDVETIAPSLYAGRSNGNHRRRGEAPSDDADTLARDAASVAPAAGARNEAPTTGGPSSITNHAPGAIETGMPGSDPFGGD